MLIKTNYFFNGYQNVHQFKNGYGASVACNDLSYGGPKGLEELAVLKLEEDGSWEICYDTPITGNVIGYLTPGEVEELLKAIEAL